MDNVLILAADQFVKLMFGYAATLILVWGIYWAAVLRSEADPYAIVRDTGFLRIVTVGFTLCAVVILCLARVFSGELAASIVSGMSDISSAAQSRQRTIWTKAKQTRVTPLRTSIERLNQPVVVLG